jgi:hypothetical protein
MRNTMTVALKLIGIIAIYWASRDIAQLGVAVSYISRRPSAVGDMAPLITWLVLFAIPLALAIILLTRTGWVIDLLKIPLESPPASAMDPSQLLHVGLVVLGAFILLQAIPEIGSTTYTYFLFHSQFPNRSQSDSELARCVSAAIKFLLGCIVIGKSRHFALSVFPRPPE